MSVTEVAADLRDAAGLCFLEWQPAEEMELLHAIGDRLEALADRRPAEQAVLDAALAWYLIDAASDDEEAALASLRALDDAVRAYQEATSPAVVSAQEEP